MDKLPSITDYTVQNNLIEGEYKEYLHRSLFDVSIRLYHSSKPYKHIVDASIDYLASMFLKEFSDYSEIKGVSGANLGVPFNIVAVKQQTGNILVMVNPKILAQEGETRTVNSNCGSLLLDTPIEVVRRAEIEAKYYARDRDCSKLSRRISHFEGPEASTIQHEVDHNNGITILDRQVSGVKENYGSYTN